MKKYIILLLGFCLLFSSNLFAGDIRDVDTDAWLEHIGQMQVLRQQILRLTTKDNPTLRDRQMLDSLTRAFDEERQRWDEYLVRVATGQEQSRTMRVQKRVHRHHSHQDCCETDCDHTTHRHHRHHSHQDCCETDCGHTSHKAHNLCNDDCTKGHRMRVKRVEKRADCCGDDCDHDEKHYQGRKKVRKADCSDCSDCTTGCSSKGVPCSRGDRAQKRAHRKSCSDACSH